MPIRPRPEQETAHAQAPDEDREDGRGRCRGGAEDQPEIAQPANLIHEGAEAGTKQQGSDEPGS